MCGSRETRQDASSPPTTTPAFRCCNASTGVFSHELTANSNSVTSQPPHELINKRNNKYTHALRLTHNGPQIAAPVVQTITSGRTIVTGHKTQYTHTPRGTRHPILCVVWCARPPCEGFGSVPPACVAHKRGGTTDKEPAIPHQSM